MELRKKALLLACAAVVSVAGCSRSQSAGPSLPLRFDRYGGLSSVSGHNTSGFFRTELIDRRWVFVDPDNHAFLSLGANHVSFSADDVPLFGFSEYNHNLLSLFPSSFPQYALQQWTQDVMDRYAEIGFNTLGNWSEDGLTVFHDSIPYTFTMGFVGAVEGGFGPNDCPAASHGFSSDFPDVFDPRFRQDAYAYAREAIGQGTVADPWLIGYFIDNELSWFGGAQLIYNPGYTLADDYIGLPSTYAGKQYWVNIFLQKERGYSLDRLDQLYGTSFTSWTQVLDTTKLPNSAQYPQIQADKQAFLYDIASTYFSVTDGALKSVDPNHLDLCARFASDAPDQVIVAASQYCDAISVNDYYALDNVTSNQILGDPVKRWTRFFTLSMTDNTYGKPFIQSEFGTRGDDAGLPDTRGAGWSVRTQNDRVQFYDDDLQRLLGIQVRGITFMAGFHWFEWTDEPATGRFDGENSNYGLVDIKDEAYTTVFDGMANTVKSLMYGLDRETPQVLAPPGFITESTLSDNAVDLSWGPVRGASGYRVIVSPFRTMPDRFTMEIDDVVTTHCTLPSPLPQGTWWFGVQAVGQGNVRSDVSTLSDFTITSSMNDAQSCMDIEDPGCFTNDIPDTFPAPDNTLGSGAAMPVTAIRNTGTQSLMIVFTLNSLALQSGLPQDATVALGMNRPLPLNGASTLSFDVYPEVVYTPSGAYRSATDFVHLRLLSGGAIVYDSPLPSSLPPYSWSTVGVPISGTDVTPVFYIDARSGDIPWDQRIVFSMDNMILK
ncbi:MAG: hypothetical protein M1491_08160 [Deltaproteobacteria bacterium]|nr:hypothetical protein [Deltaproteobacteria bacterium]MCL5278044.1 hypothetical protein [Deltaproteobacteria bacterium]